MSKQLGLSISKHRIHFTQPFGISKLTRSYQDVIRVSIVKNDVTGIGEAPAIPYYGLTCEKMQATLESKRKLIESCSWADPRTFYEQLCTLFPDQSFLRAALDGAAWDWYGQSMQQPLWQLIDFPNPTSAAPTNFTIGLSDPETMLEEMQSFPWGCYKLKLGSDQDQAIMAHIMAHSSAPLRIDANGAWGLAATKSFLANCAAQHSNRIELIEEPFRDISEKGIVALAQESPIPFFADESFQNSDDLERLQPIFKGVNIKLDKCGGLTPAMELIQQSKAAGFLIQLGCMSGSGIGLAPAVQLSGAADVVDLDSVLMIKGEQHSVYYENEVALVRN